MLISRTDLYERIWTSPTQLLAKELGLSYVGVSKICKRNNVPKPPRGYWAQVAAKKKPPRIPLPNPEQNQLIDIRGTGLNDEVSRDSLLPTRVLKAVESQHIVVPDIMRKPHPLVQETQEILKKSQVDDRGILTPRRDAHCLNMKVSIDLLPRASRIFNTIIRGLEEMEIEVELTKPKDRPGYSDGWQWHPSKTGVKIRGYFIEFGISEKCAAVKVPYSEIQRTNGWSANPSAKLQIRPTGQLTLKIENHWSDIGLRHSWNDGKKQKVENCLNGFIEGLFKVAEEKHQRHLENEKREIERKLERERLESERQRIALEKTKIEDMDSRLNDLERYTKITQFITLVQGSARSRSVDCSVDSELGKWMAWASDYAENLKREAVETVPSIRNKAGTK